MDYRVIHSNLIKTLCYSDVFEFPLTLDELWKYYYGNAPITKGEIIKTLNQSTQIQKKHNYYFLPGREWIVDVRKRREQESVDKYKKAHFIANILQIIPTVRLVGISGSLAVNNALSDDDIDLFFITRKHTLWVTRLIVNMVLLLCGQKRRRLTSLAKNKICPNMFISEDNVSILTTKKNIYVAREIMQLKVLINKDFIYEEFLKKNLWIMQFFPNICIKSSPHKIKNRKISKLQTVWKTLDKWCFRLQVRYMSSYKTTEIVKENIARFHPNNREKLIIKEYNKRVQYYSKEVIKRAVSIEYNSSLISSLKHNYVPIVLASN